MQHVWVPWWHSTNGTLRHHRELAFPLGASYSGFKAVSRQCKHPLLSSYLTWVVLRSHFVVFCLVIKVPCSWFCPWENTSAWHSHTLSFSPGSPRGWAEDSCSPWPPRVMGPLLKFTCSWLHVASRFWKKAELTMAMLKQKDKIYSDCRTPGMKKNPRRNLIMAAWSLFCCGFFPP